MLTTHPEGLLPVSGRYESKKVQPSPMFVEMLNRIQPKEEEFSDEQIRALVEKVGWEIVPYNGHNPSDRMNVFQQVEEERYLRFVYVKENGASLNWLCNLPAGDNQTVEFNPHLDCWNSSIGGTMLLNFLGYETKTISLPEPVVTIYAPRWFGIYNRGYIYPIVCLASEIDELIAGFRESVKTGVQVRE